MIAVLPGAPDPADGKPPIANIDLLSVSDLDAGLARWMDRTPGALLGPFPRSKRRFVGPT